MEPPVGRSWSRCRSSCRLGRSSRSAGPRTTGPERVDAVPGVVARARVGRVGVQRAPAVGDLGRSVAALGRSQLRGDDPVPAVGFPLVVTGGHTAAHEPLQRTSPWCPWRTRRRCCPCYP